MNKKPNFLETDKDNPEGSYRRGVHQAIYAVMEAFGPQLPSEARRRLEEIERQANDWRYFGQPDRLSCPPLAALWDLSPRG